MTSYQFASVERDGPVTIVTINRPDVMNALHPPTNRELDAIFDAFEGDPEQWVAILTGAGDRAFSAGNDLKFQASGSEVKVPANGFAGLTSRFGLTKPVIAAVNGLALGAGFEIALACDIVIASEKAYFALPEPGVGLAALAGGLLRLPRAIGMKRAMELILTSRRVGAEEGKALGFVNDVVEAGALMERARAVAATICKASPMAIRAAKEAVTIGSDGPLSAAMTDQWKYPAMAALFASDDFVEGPRAFSEKRPPVWKGG